jgi:transglutaminase-like putative cysteine protease
MDFSAWFDVFLGGQWYSFDARHNHRRIGRILLARGRDAADVAISTTFGPAQFARFSVLTEGLTDDVVAGSIQPHQNAGHSIAHQLA